MDVPLPVRPRDAHKGNCGRVLVVAGSRGMTGAAVLCACAALRSGAGLVTVATPISCWPVVAAGHPCAMTLPLAEHDGRLDACCVPDLLAAARRADVVVVGPGLGQTPGVSAVVDALLAAGLPRLVVDADALNAIHEPVRQLTHPGERILTPHPGEFALLTGAGNIQDHREQVTRAFAGRFAGVLVLKGAGTLIAEGDRLAINVTGNPGMATAGSGDVLSGVIAGLWAQLLSAYDAARLGVHLHGMAGDLGATELGEWSLTAADLLDYLPRAFQLHARTHPREEPDARPVSPLPEDRHAR
ncbi:MAG: NAD(P)H-hydrate dehydratase [Gemmataceae bacterium]|nr:NAD(P)H-hydrate dehydratase [Gemmataceae bacterium]